MKIDGIEVVEGDRVFVDLTPPPTIWERIKSFCGFPPVVENGIYTASSGPWTSEGSTDG